MHEKTIERLRKALISGERISKTDLTERACKAEEKGQHFDFLVRVKKETYQEWLDKNPQLNAEEELTYIASTQSKMFQKGKCGYSLFAQSIGDMKREDKGLYSELDRLEHTPWEYAIILESEVK